MQSVAIPSLPKGKMIWRSADSLAACLLQPYIKPSFVSSALPVTLIADFHVSKTEELHLHSSASSIKLHLLQEHTQMLV